MKAIVITGSGEPQDALKMLNVEDLAPPTGSDVIVRVQKRAIHPADYQTVRGFLPTEVFADDGILGNDGVGIVEAIGSEVEPVTGIAPGVRVVLYHAHRTWAERVCVPVSSLIPLPADIGDSVACQMATNGITAVMLLHAAEQAIRSSTEKTPLIISAAGSSVAGILISLAMSKGHDVIGLVRHSADAATVAAKFDGLTVIGTDRDDWQDAISAVIKHPPLIALDPIGGEMMSALLGVLAHGGTLIIYGALDPQPSQISSGFLTARELTLRGCSATSWNKRTTPQSRASDFQTLFDIARNSPQLFANYQEFKLGDAAQAIAAAEASPRRGAVLLVSHG